MSSMSSSSPMRTLCPNVLGVVVDYVGIPKPREVRLLQQLIRSLPPFIDEVPFVERNNDEESNGDRRRGGPRRITNEIVLVRIILPFLALCGCFVLPNSLGWQSATSLVLVTALVLYLPSMDWLCTDPYRGCTIRWGGERRRGLLRWGLVGMLRIASNPTKSNPSPVVHRQGFLTGNAVVGNEQPKRKK